MPKSAVFLMLALGAAAPASAEVDLSAADTCIAERFATGGPAKSCIQAAHAECFAVTAKAPSIAALCFEEARAVWTRAIADTMQTLTAEGPEAAATIIGIEVKYDILSGLLQCDRIEELALVVSQHPVDSIQREKSSCTAMVSGLAYGRLVLRMHNLP